MTHDEQRKRRQQIAEMVRGGASPAEAAVKFGVNLWTVYNACKVFGVKKSYHSRQIGIYKVLAELMNTDDNMQVIADRLGLTRQRIQQVLSEAVDAGIQIRGRQRGDGRKDEGQNDKAENQKWTG